ncbi:hypothetical protein CEXT_35891 [Caerostris extrusa]|uniref:Transposase n=1 Tax=Caerostris extrusa TaxID=172846 RepID=A0AAV4P900_CAEEX|nr:hypothetical protein CEXT_35891 [Caerostris extrusa]
MGRSRRPHLNVFVVEDLCRGLLLKTGSPLELTRKISVRHGMNQAPLVWGFKGCLSGHFSPDSAHVQMEVTNRFIDKQVNKVFTFIYQAQILRKIWCRLTVVV